MNQPQPMPPSRTQTQPDFSQPKSSCLKRVLITLGVIVLFIIVVLGVLYFWYSSSYNKGKELYRQGNYEQSVKKLETASKLSFGDDPLLLKFIAISHARLGQFDEAKTKLNKLTSINPTSPETYKTMAYVYALEATQNNDDAELNQAKDLMEKAWQLDSAGFSQADKDLLELLQNPPKK